MVQVSTNMVVCVIETLMLSCVFVSFFFVRLPMFAIDFRPPSPMAATGVHSARCPRISRHAVLRAAAIPLLPSSPHELKVTSRLACRLSLLSEHSRNSFLKLKSAQVSGKKSRRRWLLFPEEGSKQDSFFLLWGVLSLVARFVASAVTPG